MKIRMLCDADHRVSSALSQAFRAEAEVSVPKATAAALIARGVAEEVQKPSVTRGD